jgi:ferric iron reductase protein FhuF
MDYAIIAQWVFGLSLVLLLLALVLSVREIHISMEALNVHLNQVLTERKNQHGS